MIRKEEIYYIGKISKARGIRGEVELRFTDDVFDRGESEYLVLEMDGIPVPFFWEEYKFKNNETAIFKFEHVDTEEYARRLAGCRVFYPVCHTPEETEENELPSWKALTGFKVSQENGKEIGTIEHVDDSSQNILLYLRSPQDKEIILPFHDDFLVDYSLRGHSLCLRIPEELLSLND